MESLILFPCQLYDVGYLKKKGVKEVYLLEDPLFYGRETPVVRLNQLRLVYMAVCHRQWMAELKRQGIHVEHGTLEIFQKANANANANANAKANANTKKKWHWIDPCDIQMEAKMRNAGFGDPLDSPSFLLTRTHLTEYKPDATRFQHGDFYNAVKTLRSDIPILKELQTIPNLDRENRRGYHKEMPVPESAYRTRFTTPADWTEAIADVVRDYPQNPKPLLDWETLTKEYFIYLPVLPAHARILMQRFFKERFKYYGEYQDVVLLKNPIAFHSGLSIYLNNGFLTPEDVLRTLRSLRSLRDYRGYSKATIEGFVRQIAGWREYSRLYYHRVPLKAYRKNMFDNRKRSLPNAWYRGTTGVAPLDATIQYAMNYGYINHIQRLMVVSNYMTLDGFHPDALFKWMFEFSLDSYEWVMVFNCYSMGSWSDGGIAMRKPYISGAAYIKTMSDARDNANDWETHWTDKYRAFMKHKANILRHTQAWRPNVV